MSCIFCFSGSPLAGAPYKIHDSNFNCFLVKATVCTKPAIPMTCCPNIISGHSDVKTPASSSNTLAPSSPLTLALIILC